MAKIAALAFIGSLLAVAPAVGEGRLDLTTGQIPRSAALYCEDSSHTLQRMTHGNFGDFLDAGRKKLETGARIVPNGKRANGEPYSVVLFETDPKAAVEDYDAVSYVVTVHADGVALRYGYLAAPGKEPVRIEGSDMCGVVLVMLVELHPERVGGQRRR